MKLPDLNLPICAIDEGRCGMSAPELCSCDTDFARFPGLRWSEPLG